MYDVNSNASNQVVEISKASLWMILTNTNLVECMEITLNIYLGMPTTMCLNSTKEINNLTIDIHLLTKRSLMSGEELEAMLLLFDF
jgi:hypothetical protein